MPPQPKVVLQGLPVAGDFWQRHNTMQTLLAGASLSDARFAVEAVDPKSKKREVLKNVRLRPSATIKN